VATTAERDLLNTVNCLLAGAPSLPESVLLEAAAAAGNRRKTSATTIKPPLPYVAVGPVDPLDMPWQRSHQYGKHSF
jgi:hypothetical protein